MSVPKLPPLSLARSSLTSLPHFRGEAAPQAPTTPGTESSRASLSQSRRVSTHHSSRASLGQSPREFIPSPSYASVYQSPPASVPPSPQMTTPRSPHTSDLRIIYNASYNSDYFKEAHGTYRESDSLRLRPRPAGTIPEQAAYRWIIEQPRRDDDTQAVSLYLERLKKERERVQLCLWMGIAVVVFVCAAAALAAYEITSGGSCSAES